MLTPVAILLQMSVCHVLTVAQYGKIVRKSADSEKP